MTLKQVQVGARLHENKESMTMKQVEQRILSLVDSGMTYREVAERVFNVNGRNRRFSISQISRIVKKRDEEENSKLDSNKESTEELMESDKAGNNKLENLINIIFYGIMDSYASIFQTTILNAPKDPKNPPYLTLLNLHVLGFLEKVLEADEELGRSLLVCRNPLIECLVFHDVLDFYWVGDEKLDKEQKEMRKEWVKLLLKHRPELLSELGMYER